MPLEFEYDRRRARQRILRRLAQYGLAASDLRLVRPPRGWRPNALLQLDVDADPPQLRLVRVPRRRLVCDRGISKTGRAKAPADAI